jgi:hypothetical protein
VIIVKGNGYIRMVLEEGREEAIFDCNTCNNQGEIEIKEPSMEELVKMSRLQ